MTNTTNTTAFESGKDDGADRVQQDRNSNGGQPVKASSYKGGSVEADEALINACSTSQLAEVLGLTFEQVEAKGDDFWAACKEYNRGFAAGVAEEADEE